MLVTGEAFAWQGALLLEEDEEESDEEEFEEEEFEPEDADELFGLGQILLVEPPQTNVGSLTVSAALVYKRLRLVGRRIITPPAKTSIIMSWNNLIFFPPLDFPFFRGI